LCDGNGRRRLGDSSGTADVGTSTFDSNSFVQGNPIITAAPPPAPPPVPAPVSAPSTGTPSPVSDLTPTSSPTIFPTYSSNNNGGLIPPHTDDDGVSGPSPSGSNSGSDSSINTPIIVVSILFAVAILAGGVFVHTNYKAKSEIKKVNPVSDDDNTSNDIESGKSKSLDKGMPLNSNDISHDKKEKEIVESVSLARRLSMDRQNLYEGMTEIRSAAVSSHVGNNNNITVNSNEITKNLDDVMTPMKVKAKSKAKKKSKGKNVKKGNATITSAISNDDMEIEYENENLSEEDSNENMNVLSIQEHETPSIDNNKTKEKAPLQRSLTANIKKVKVLHEFEIADLERDMMQEKQREKNKNRLTTRLNNRSSYRRASRMPSMRIQMSSNGDALPRKFSAPKLFIDGAKPNNFLNTNKASTIIEGYDNSDEEVRRVITTNDMTPDERRHSRRLSMSKRLSQQLNVSSAITSNEGQVMNDGYDNRNKSNLGNILSHLQNLKEDDSSIEDLDAILNSPLASSQTSTTNIANNKLNKTNPQKNNPKKKKIKKKCKKRRIVTGQLEDLEQELDTKNGKKEDTDVNVNVLDDLKILDGDSSNVNVKKNKLKKKKKKKKIKNNVNNNIDKINTDLLIKPDVDAIHVTPTNLQPMDANSPTVTYFNDTSDDDSIDLEYIL